MAVPRVGNGIPVRTWKASSSLNNLSIAQPSGRRGSSAYSVDYSTAQARTHEENARPSTPDQRGSGRKGSTARGHPTGQESSVRVALPALQGDMGTYQTPSTSAGPHTGSSSRRSEAAYQYDEEGLR